MERIRAMDPSLGEAVAAARAVELAVSEGWNSVIFESDSRLLCLDISHPFRVPCWKIEELVSSIHAAFERSICLGDSLGPVVLISKHICWLSGLPALSFLVF